LITALAMRDDVAPVAYALTWRGRQDIAGSLPDGVTAATARLPARLVRGLWARGLAHPAVERWTGPVDLVHALNYVAPPTKVPVVVMVHDLTFVRFPELCTRDTLQYGDLVRRAVARGAVIHTPSEFVAAEVRAELSVPEDRVVAIHSGLAAVGGGDAAAGSRLAGGKRYVLALGTIEPRKNLPALVRAFTPVAAADPDVRLVVAGPDGWDRDRFTTAVERSPHRDRIVRLGYVSAPARRDLLAGATVFAYPSRYEGFGFPPLEAMAAGIPVVAARAGALPEVLGEAARFVDPDRDDELAAAIAALLDDATAREDLVSRGRERAARYSWTTTAAAVAALYRSLS
jgi:glycosyltransferase involved in cell wall biosynthesis